MVRTRTDALLLGEWACLALLAHKPAHGYDLATRLAPRSDIGRVWSLSRPLTYRALDQLQDRELVKTIGEERGRAGGNRTILAPTRQGRTAVKRWLTEPVPHLRDVRSQLLLKLVLCDLNHIDLRPLLEAQHTLFTPVIGALSADGGPRTAASDPVAVWRYESSRATMRFLDRLLADKHDAD